MIRNQKIAERVKTCATDCNAVPGIKTTGQIQEVNNDMETQKKACINYGYCGRPLL